MSRVVFTKIDIGSIQKNIEQKICLILIASPKNCHISAQENCQTTAVAARTQIRNIQCRSIINLTNNGPVLLFGTLEYVSE